MQCKFYVSMNYINPYNFKLLYYLQSHPKCVKVVIFPFHFQNLVLTVFSALTFWVDVVFQYVFSAYYPNC